MKKDILSVGDRVIVKTKWANYDEKIVRETKTMLITRSVRIYKKDNSIVGNPYTYARHITQEDIDKIIKAKLAYKLRNTDFDKLSLGKLNKIDKIIEKKEKTE